MGLDLQDLFSPRVASSSRTDTDVSGAGGAIMNLLGGFELRIGAQVEPLSRSAQRLLVFLAVHDRPLSRSFVAQSLWLDSTEGHADGNLRYLLWKIGRTGTDLIERSEGRLAIGPISVDYHFGMWLANTLLDDPSKMDPSTLDERILSDDLLPDWQDEWILQHQERYRQLRLHALESLCLLLISDGRFSRAIQAGLAAVAAEPLREGPNLALVRAYYAAGSSAEAVRHSRRFEKLLGEELGQSPSSGFRLTIQALGAR
jgi:DNA-binding SARP family transcriptional activator